MTDYKLVPLEPTPEMVEAAEEAHMPFGDMDMAIRMALLAAPDHIADAGKMVAAAAQGVESRPLPANRYGVDCDYFTKKLEILIRDMGNYTPAELARTLGRLAMTADSETMREPEFNTAPAVQGEPVERQSVLNLSEAARSLGVAQEKGDQGAIDHWGAMAARFEREVMQPVEQKPSTHWSHDNPGLADQYRAESLAARRSLGFEQDAYDVAPADIAAAIESLTRTAPDMPGLNEALRQYRNNDGSGLVFGYDKLLVDRHVAGLVEALERIMTWPDGGRHYGQSNIKVFAAKALAAYHKGADRAAVEHADALIAELDRPVKVSGSKLCVGCNSVRPTGEFDEASPEYPTRDGRVYKCRKCVKEASQ